MPRYTLQLFRGSPAPERSQAGDYPSDAAAIKDARAFLARVAATTEDRPLSVSVGRGEGDEPEWLGAWDFDGSPRWEAAE